MEAEHHLTKLMEENGWEITYMNNRKGSRYNPESKLPAIFTEMYEDLTGVAAKSYFMAGGTYARHLKNACAVGYWAHDLDSKAMQPEMPAGHGSAHQRDECISIDAHFQGIRILVHYLLAADRYLNEN